MSGPISQPPGEAPAIVSAGLDQLLQQARSLGLTWSLRLATISTISPLTAIFDGDTVPLNVTSMTGGYYYSAQRVYVIILPPAGNFVVGYADPPTLGYNCYTTQSLTAGTTTSATYVDMPGSPGLTITKLYDETSLRLTTHLSWFSTGSAASALFAATSGSSQAFLARQATANGTLNNHTVVSGTAIVSGINRGLQTWTGAWAKVGGGTLSVDTTDFYSLCVEEFWLVD
jgi:hypothetical protein